MQVHYATSTPSVVIPINDTEGGEITRLVILPVKWEAELADINPTPHTFLQFIENKKKDRVDTDGEYHDYLVAWSLVACNAENKTSVKSRSQLHASLLDINGGNDSLEEWVEI